ncbi:MAG: hypothetical protein RJA10_2669, partial [Pseudomonadota bacterium]
MRPQQDGCDVATAGSALACAGYGSSVTVTATFGLVAAGEALAQRLEAAGSQRGDDSLKFRAIM